MIGERFAFRGGFCFSSSSSSSSSSVFKGDGGDGGGGGVGPGLLLLVRFGDVRLNDGNEVFVRIPFVRLDALFDAELGQRR